MKSLLAKKITASIVRHVLTAVGGGLIAQGYVDAGTWEVVTGGAVAASGVAWAWAEKKAAFSF